MPHLDPDRLVLIAIGDGVSDGGETAHLDGCPQCRAELGDLREVAGHAADARQLRELPAPPERVWQGILAQVTEAPTVAATESRTGPSTEAPDRPPPHRASVRSRRWPESARLLLVAAVAAVLAVGGTLGVTELLDQEPAVVEEVTAQAALTPLETVPVAAHGEARVLDGHTLHLHVTGLEQQAGYYEVWLINPDTMEMISIGVWGEGPDLVLPLPPTVDLGAYRLVDVSLEEYDGDTSHSGNSIVRGVLGD
ncbi:anti-sigma factor [Natronosporangium hydrolyticum]|uniref:Anti-sigma factor n=1 Tax=Natronosporangium hydrolyticum TaxID=2811111 RepID=A0A895YFD4_9ACTN|nr:anti-sigma factor [Natronosporangium hydrolyticum]QSB14123.1 anti-sigma factor [Natronosporangium hydrolyticum]